jgi:hypothetical protein
VKLSFVCAAGAYAASSALGSKLSQRIVRAQVVRCRAEGKIASPQGESQLHARADVEASHPFGLLGTQTVSD